MDHLVRHLQVFAGKRVLITGDTGFKGSWLSYWLTMLGADVYGYALPPDDARSHFTLLRLNTRISHVDGDILDFDTLANFMAQARPEFVFHLAAQALVRKSYEDPKATFDTNVSGSVNLLECVRQTPSVRSLVYVTSDKCYRNKEWVWGYRESDELGGHDPYSASKAAAEVVFSAYQDSFLRARSQFGAASVRAGNVIGGGDWSADRIVPDCVRALTASQPITLRNPEAVRPWQHVLEPLSGYLLLALRLRDDPDVYSDAWNLGPRNESVRTVRDVAETMARHWGNGTLLPSAKAKDERHEAGTLVLNCDKANHILHWYPQWDFERAVEATASWYRRHAAGEAADSITREQVTAYMGKS